MKKRSFSMNQSIVITGKNQESGLVCRPHINHLMTGMMNNSRSCRRNSQPVWTIGATSWTNCDSISGLWICSHARPTGWDPLSWLPAPSPLSLPLSPAPSPSLSTLLAATPWTNCDSNSSTSNLLN
ncbi:hypothetical protein M758_6G099700 [Ceratodon purpureus]|nr:hypothetical protein M758_6G099700 [Ceratodon purpureus]